MGARYVSAAYRELGDRLRRIRENADMTAADVADRLGWPPTMISRMENGRRTSNTVEVVQYVAVCGMKMPDVGPILEFTRLAERKQGYHLSDKWIDGTLQSLIFHESSATHILSYEAQVIPGLLQTPDYAHARILAFFPDVSEETVAGGVRTRMERRQVLYVPNPGRFTFYIHEQALRLRAGTNEIMQEQLLHVVLTAALDNVTIRIVPNAAGTFGDGFRLMEFRDCRPIVYLDDLRFGGLILEDPNYVDNYYKCVPNLADVALDEGQSREFVAGLADEHDRGSQRGGTDVLAQEQLQQRTRHGLRGGGLAEEQPQPLGRNRLRGGGMEPPTPIYE